MKHRDLWPFGEFKKKFKDGRFTHYCTVPDKFSVMFQEEKEDE